MKQLSVLVLVLALGGCSMMPYYSQLKAVADTGIDTGIEDRRDFNDKKALIIKALAGEVTRGAMLRSFTPDERCAIDTLILGSPTEECSIMDRIATAMEGLSKALGQQP
jgi:hypothetical protein